MGDIGRRHRSFVLFIALLLFTWYFAATLFLIFAGVLLGVALTAMANMLGRVVKLPHSLRLTVVGLAFARVLSNTLFLGGATIAQQTKVLSDTIKSQLVDLKAFLDRNGVDTSFFDFGSLNAGSDASAPAAPTTPTIAFPAPAPSLRAAAPFPARA